MVHVEQKEDFRISLKFDYKFQRPRVLFIMVINSDLDIVSDDTPTFNGKTPIDYIFLNFDSKQNYRVEIEKDRKFSDHKYVQVELDY